MVDLPVASRSRLVAYLAALGAVAVAAGVDLVLLPWITPSVTPAFLLAVAIAAYYGGFLPGIAASVASIVLLVFLFYPTATLSGQSTAFRVVNYLATVAGLVLIGGLAHRSRRLALEQARENRALRDHAESALQKLQGHAELARGGAEASSRLAAIVTSSHDAIVGKTLEGVVTSWNAAAERIFGYTAAEIIGQPIFRLIPEDRHDAERQLLERLRRGESVELEEAERIRKDGERIWISLSVSPVRDAEGRLVGAASIKRDITERRRAEAELRRHQDQLRLAHRAARIGTWHWDVATRHLTWDEGLRQLYGVASGETVTDLAGFLARVFPEDRERVEASFQQALQAPGGLAHEYRIVRPGGEIRWLADLGQVGVDDERPPPLRHRDLSRHHRAPRRGGAAARSPPAAGRGAARRRHRARGQQPDVGRAGRRSLPASPEGPSRGRGGRRGARPPGRRAHRDDYPAAARLQPAAAPPARERGPQRAGPHGRAPAAALPRGEPGAGDPDGPAARPGVGRPQPAGAGAPQPGPERAGRDAEGGQVTIETGREEQTAMLMVRDTGVGMDQQTLQRAFEPFFTTKEIGQGTGLGLSVVHGIVAQIGGKIEAASQPGHGSLFTLRLPIVARSHPIAEGKAAAAGAPAGGATVLVVEDDEAVRRMTVRALSEAGYGTVEAVDGQDALDLVSGAPLCPTWW